MKKIAFLILALLSSPAHAAFPQPIFQVRGTALKPYYSRGASNYVTQRMDTANTTTDAVVSALGTAGVFGGSVIDRSGSSDGYKKLLIYPGFNNWTSTGVFSVLMRIIPDWTGNPSVKQNLWQVGAGDTYPNTFYADITTTGKLWVSLTALNGGDLIYGNSVASLSFTAGTPTDIMVTCDGNHAAGTVLKIYQDGVFIENISYVATSTQPWRNLAAPLIRFGWSSQAGFQVGHHTINEFDIFDSVVGAYATRTDFVPSIKFNGDGGETSAVFQ